AIIIMIIIAVIMSVVRPRLAIGGPDRDRPRQITAKDPKQEKLAGRVHACPLGQIGAHMPFGQQVREERQNPRLGRLEGRDQLTELILEAKTENGTVFIGDISIVEGKEN